MRRVYRMLSMPHTPVSSILFLLNLALAEAVTCYTCFDQVPGCTGGADCPFTGRSANNNRLCRGVAMAVGAVGAAAATKIVVAELFPLRFTKVLTQAVLDCFLVVARRPAPGANVDLSALTLQQLAEPVHTHGADSEAMLDEVSRRLAAAGTQLEISRLNAMANTINAKRNVSTEHGTIADADGKTTVVGVYRYLLVMAAKVVRTRDTDVASVEVEEPSTGNTAKKVLPPLRQIRPNSVGEMSAFLTTWTMLLDGLGTATILISGRFLHDVVYTPLADGLVTWQQAFELLLVYLEEIERVAGDEVNLSNVYDRGAQDTMLKRARERAPGKPKADGGGDDFREDGACVVFNGSWNKKATRTCHTFNMQGKKPSDHPPASLNPNGTCKFLHACDKYVTNNGPAGMCLGNHPRWKCNNPNVTPDGKPHP